MYGAKEDLDLYSLHGPSAGDDAVLFTVFHLSLPAEGRV